LSSLANTLADHLQTLIHKKKMKFLLIALLLVLALESVNAQDSADSMTGGSMTSGLICPCDSVTIDFQDIPSGTVSSYFGFTWTNFVGQGNAIVGTEGTFYYASGFDLESVTASAASTSQVTVTGWLAGVQVASVNINLSATASTFDFTSVTGFSDVDTIKITCPVAITITIIVVGCPPANVQQDPQFVGLQGQHFQVHGLADSVFNLISSPSMQLNSRFVYLSNGKCFYNNTACWSHPGTYLQSLGFGYYDQHVEVRSNAHDNGLSVFINGDEIQTSNKQQVLTTVYNKNTHAVVSYPINGKLIFETEKWQIVATNADFFINIQVSLLDSDIMRQGRQKVMFSGVHPDTQELTQGELPTVKPHIHGLVGQTWLNAEYANKQLFEGEILEYWLESNNLFGNDFMYNNFQH